MLEVKDIIYLEDLMRKGERLNWDDTGRIIDYQSFAKNSFQFPSHWDPDKIFRNRGFGFTSPHSDDCASDSVTSAQRSEHNTTKSVFFRLPSEIRNRVYDFIFDEPILYICNHVKTTSCITNHETGEPREFRIKKPGISLVPNAYAELAHGKRRWKPTVEIPWPTKTWLVCKQMRQETYLMIYSRAIFNFDASTEAECGRKAFIDNLAPIKRAAIRKVAICLTCGDGDSILGQNTAVDRYLPSVPHLLHLQDNSNLRMLTGLREILIHLHWDDDSYSKNDEQTIENRIREEFSSAKPFGCNLLVEVTKQLTHDFVLI